MSGYVGPARTGVARTLKNLLANMKRVSGAHQYRLYTNWDNRDFDDIVDEETVRVSAVRVSRFRSLWNLLWHQGPFQYHLARDRADAAFIPNVTLLLWKTCPTVVMIHDLIEFNVPDKFSRMRMLYRRFAVPVTAKRADSIITGSECSKRDIVKHCGVHPDKIEVIFDGVDEIFRPLSPEETSRQLARFDVDYPYILYVGTIDHPGKNGISLLRAFCEIADRHPEYKLVMIGQPGHGFEHITAEIAQRRVAERVVLPGFVDDESLVAFYNGATVLALLSLYEGFGLPLVEAMACGTPVLAANTSCLPEIVGDAGLIVEPLEIPQIGSGLESIIADKDLAESLRRRGFERAKMFSWERAATRISDHLGEVASRHS